MTKDNSAHAPCSQFVWFPESVDIRMQLDGGGIKVHVPKVASKWWHSKHKVATRFRSFARLMAMPLDALEALALEGNVPYFEHKGQKYVIQLEAQCPECSPDSIQWAAENSGVSTHES